jgi:hypothetical protein
MYGIDGPMIVMIIIIIVVLCFWVFDPFAWRRTDHPEKENDPRQDEIPIANLLLMGALAVMAFNSIKKAYSFLRDVDWNALTEQDREALSRFNLDLARFHSNNARLDRAESLASFDDQTSIEVSALLASATLESGLKHLQEYHHIMLTEEQSEGVVGIAVALRDRSLVSNEEYREIRRYVSNVRNKVMHGEFDSLDSDEVRELVRFIRGFFAAHSFA